MGMRKKIIWLSIWVISSLFAREKVLLDSFFDPKKDYSVFSGRITDRGELGHIIKISSENPNIKFFRAGDSLEFTVASKDLPFCQGHIRHVDKGHFVIYVKDIKPCWGKQDIFRRGTALIFKAQSLQKRIEEMARHRVVLLKRKRDFLKELNQINNFLHSYNQKKIVIAAKYDQRIIEIEKEKESSLEKLISKREDRLKIQRELIKRIKDITEDLEHYRISEYELFEDRWHMDLQLGLPVKSKPQELKAR
jgi:hypothetical protein